MAMRIRTHKQSRTEATSIPSQPFGRVRPFAPQPTPTTETSVPDLQTQLDRARRFGHHFGNYRISHAAFPPAPIQPKLTIGAPGDKYEQEADWVAQRVVQQLRAPHDGATQAMQSVQQQSQVMGKEILQAQWLTAEVRANTERWDKEINGIIWFKETLDGKVRYAPWTQMEGIEFYGDAAYDLDGSLWYSKEEWPAKWQEICNKNDQQEMKPLVFPDEGTTMEMPSGIWKQEVEEIIDNHLVEHLALPTVTSNGPPQYSPDGAFAWSVTMSIQDAQAVDCWIVQKVKLRSSRNPEWTFFWEAFPVLSGQTEALYKDIYQNNLRDENGWMRVEGKMQTVRCEGGKVPPGLFQGKVEEADREQFTSYVQPNWWQSGGTEHNLSFTLWEGELVEKESTTVPKSGKWEKKNSYRDINHG
jgi:hypothetical protein